MNSQKDYTGYAFRITFLVIVMLLIITVAGPFTVGGVYLKRANILSDLIEFNESIPEAMTVDRELDAAFIAEAEKLAKDTIQPPVSPPVENTTEVWNMGSEPIAGTGESYSSAITDFENIIPIEDFTVSGNPSISSFSRKLESGREGKPVKIAFLGDSFIEGDLITGDVREQLQEMYGGSGIGFVPFSTVLAQNRPTIKHNWTGWSTYSLLNKRSVPERYRELFYISGVLSVAKNKASSTYQFTDFRRGLYPVSQVRILYRSIGEGSVTVTINDTISRTFTVEDSDQVRQLLISGNNITKLKVDVDPGEEFIGYGVVFGNSSGVRVDNYSMRSNSGLALFGTSSAVNRQVSQALGGYDLVVLQYGLNAMDPNSTNYTNYGQQFGKVIEYMRSCFPGAAILVMGIGDRSTQRDGVFVTMRAVESMVSRQRETASEAGAAFWNTYQAMGGSGSMAAYVRKGWAAKDYTHLSFRGGKEIAGELVRALIIARYHTAGPAENAEDLPVDELSSDSLPQLQLDHNEEVHFVIPDEAGEEHETIWNSEDPENTHEESDEQIDSLRYNQDILYNNTGLLDTIADTDDHIPDELPDLDN